MSYLIDADVFIRAKDLHYGFDFCPAFWDWLIRTNLDGNVYSIERVGDELKAGNDELADWARERDGDFFMPPDAALLPALARVSAWVTSQTYEQGAISTFFQIADYYLVAQALAGGHTVVTHEVPAASTRRIKIPNVCLGVGVKYVLPFEMLRSERARFVLEPSA